MRENSNCRIIKRYQNRKLYDTHQSCYVTLEEISQIIRDGHEIKVIDNKTKNDITYNTQIQLLFDMERKQNSVQDTDLLKRVIRSHTGTFSGHLADLEMTYGLTPKSITTQRHIKTTQDNTSYRSAENDSLESGQTLN